MKQVELDPRVSKAAIASGRDLIGFVIAVGTGLMPPQVRARPPAEPSGRREKHYGQPVWPLKSNNRRAKRRARGKAKENRDEPRQS